MEGRRYQVPARTSIEARERALALSRHDMFDPLRVGEIRVLGLEEMTDDGAMFRYEVELEGVTLTEGEARELYGH